MRHFRNMGNPNTSLICTLNFLLVFINIQVLSFAKPHNLGPSTWFSVWDLIHLEDSIRHGTIPNFSKILESKNPHYLRQNNVYDMLDSDGTKILQSSPGCPEPFEKAPWVYSSIGDEHQPRCYLAGFQGPCPPNMKLYPQSSSYYGYCDCSCKEYFGNKVNVPRAYCIGSGNIRSETDDNGNDQAMSSNRILAFDKEADACHILFEQGRCGENEWLVFGDDPTSGLICEGRQCPSDHGEGFSFYDFKTRECHRLSEECGNQELINKNDTTEYTSSSLERDNNWAPHSYQLDENSWIPECQIDVNYQEIEYKFYSHPIQPFSCKSYERFSLLLARCIPIFTRKSYFG